MCSRYSVGNRAVSGALDGEESPVHDVISAPGRPLADQLRQEMEARLGHDFSEVRIHTDSAAQVSARSVDAQAYTAGSHVVFQRGVFDPDSHAGKTLLAHELTHVVQQRRGPVSGTPAPGHISLSDPSDRFERAAAENAVRAMTGTVQRTITRHHRPKAGSPTSGTVHVQRGRGKVKGPVAKVIRDEIFGNEDVNGDTNRRSSGVALADAMKSQWLNARRSRVTINSGNQVLEGRFYDPQAGDAGRTENQGTVVLLLTGSGGSAERQGQPIAIEYLDAGIPVLSVNYRGFGHSHKQGKQLAVGGTPTEQGLYQDAEAMFEYLKHTKGFNRSSVIVHGFSLGGPVAAHVAKYVRKQGKTVKALVLDRAMPSAYKAARNDLKDSGGFTGLPGMRHLGGAITKASAGKMSIDAKVRKLGTDLPILFATTDDDMQKGDERAFKRARKRGQRAGHVYVPAQGGGVDPHMDSEHLAPHILALLRSADLIDEL